MQVDIILTFMRNGTGYTKLMDLLAPIVQPTKRLETTRSTFDILYSNIESHVAIVIYGMVVSNKFDDVISFHMEYSTCE